QELRRELVDGLVEEREIHGALGEESLPGVALRSLLGLAEAGPTVRIGAPVGPDQRVGDPAVGDAERRDDVGEEPQPIRLVRAPRLAGGAGEHRVLDADEERQEVGRAAVRRGAVPWTGLTEAREVLRDGVVTGHADL